MGPGAPRASPGTAGERLFWSPTPPGVSTSESRSSSSSSWSSCDRSGKAWYIPAWMAEIPSLEHGLLRTVCSCKKGEVGCGETETQ